MKLTTRAQACSSLQSLRHAVLLGQLLAAWNEETRVVLCTRAWFNKQQEEREKEGQVWFWPEGEDEISLLKRRLALKVWAGEGGKGRVGGCIVTSCWFYQSMGRHLYQNYKKDYIYKYGTTFINMK